MELVGSFASCLPDLTEIQPDVVKAACLGARAVGLGRPFLYAQSVSSVVMANLIKKH